MRQNAGYSSAIPVIYSMPVPETLIILISNILVVLSVKTAFNGPNGAYFSVDDTGTLCMVP